MTDEQLREQFEEWIEGKQYGLGWQNGRGTWEEFLSATWAGYQAGSRSRDAEVQALRKGLALISRLYDSSESDDAVLLREAVDIATCATEDADAALAGDEIGGEDE